MRASLAFAFAVLVAMPVSALDGPDQLIRSVYAAERAPDTHALVERYFAADLAKALEHDSSDPNEVGAVDFDYRYAAQDWDTKTVNFSTGGVNGQTWVSATFTNFGEAKEVLYAMCLRKDGWRIADVHAPDRDWSLRDMLKLAATVKC
jgi:hypothetical protein